MRENVVQAFKAPLPQQVSYKKLYSGALLHLSQSKYRDVIKVQAHVPESAELTPDQRFHKTRMRRPGVERGPLQPNWWRSIVRCSSLAKCVHSLPESSPFGPASTSTTFRECQARAELLQESRPSFMNGLGTARFGVANAASSPAGRSICLTPLAVQECCQILPSILGVWTTTYKCFRAAMALCCMLAYLKWPDLIIVFVWRLQFSGQSGVSLGAA